MLMNHSSASVSGISHMASIPHSSNCELAQRDSEKSLVRRLVFCVSLAQHLDGLDTPHSPM